MINDSVLFYYSETKRERDVYKTEKELYYLYPLLIAILPYKPMVHLLNPPPPSAQRRTKSHSRENPPEFLQLIF